MVVVAVTVLAGALSLLSVVVALIKYQYISLTVSTSIFELFMFPDVLYQYTPPLFFKGPQWKLSYPAFLLYPCPIALYGELFKDNFKL